MFEPNDFLDLSMKLIDSDYKEIEAMMRTVVSRVYYSSFLKCKQLAINHGQIQLKQYDRKDFPRKGEIHQAVRDALHEIGLGHVASKLYDLFERRVIADYKVVDDVKRPDAKEAIELSMNIKDLIKPYE